MPAANAIPCLFCQNILFQFSALCLPNSCHRQLDSVDVAKASLPAHYPIPCHALSFPAPSRHKLIGLNPVINRLEKQLSMFAPLLNAGLFGHCSRLFFSPLLVPTHHSIMPSPPFSLGSHAHSRPTSLDTLAAAQMDSHPTCGLCFHSDCFQELGQLFIL